MAAKLRRSTAEQIEESKRRRRRSYSHCWSVEWIVGGSEGGEGHVEVDGAKIRSYADYQLWIVGIVDAGGGGGRGTHAKIL